MSRSFGAFAFAALVISPLIAAAVVIDTVPVNYLNNAAHYDPGANGHFGSISYRYRMGTYEVTNDQYAEFLNAKAASDPLGLYNPNMAASAQGGILRSGTSGSYTYAIKPNMGNKPVTWVSGYDAMRFANWLHNGQGPSSTETGAYTLLGGAPIPSNASSITRLSGAKWFVPTTHEFAKAGWYQPFGAGGPSDHYWQYPTRSETAPTAALANSVGDIANPGPNVANHSSAATWNGDVHVTTVGSAGPASASFFGTYDQGGNVSEWMHIGNFLGGLGGGTYWYDPVFLGTYNGAFSGGNSPEFESYWVGMRMAQVPEPGTLVLAALGSIGVLLAARRRMAPHRS